VEGVDQPTTNHAFITLFDGEDVTENLVDGMVGVGHVGDIRRIK
jgi:hypothetical protein